ncbi:MAG: helix-turn-helix domain-containing protein [Propionibacteriaceae bacterium]
MRRPGRRCSGRKFVPVLSILKNNRATPVRFTTLTGLCDALGRLPGDLFSVKAPPR